MEQNAVQSIGTGRGIRRRLSRLGWNHRITLSVSQEVQITNKEGTQTVEELAWPNKRDEEIFQHLITTCGGTWRQAGKRAVASVGDNPCHWGCYSERCLISYFPRDNPPALPYSWYLSGSPDIEKQLSIFFVQPFQYRTTVSGVLNNWHNLISLQRGHLSVSSFLIFFLNLTLINDIYEVPSQDLPVKEVKAWKVSLPLGILYGKWSRGGWKILS